MSIPVYSASYSGVAVYESYFGNTVVMRRNDGSMNASQLLKAAGLPKFRRTRVIETEIIGKGIPFERVQGGYGKYQGTWVGLEDARKLCRMLGIEKGLDHMLNLEPGQQLRPKKPMKMVVRQAAERRPTEAPKPSLVPQTPTKMPFSSPFSHKFSSAHSKTEDIMFEENDPQASITRRLFDETGTQSDFFRSVTRRRRIAEAKLMEPDFSFNVLAGTQDMSNIRGRSLDERRKQILMAIYAQDNERLGMAAVFLNLEIDENTANDIEKTSEKLSLKTNQRNEGQQINERSTTRSSARLTRSHDLAQPEIVKRKNYYLEMRLDDRSSTSLHWAAGCARLGLVYGLIINGADPRSYAFDGETPLIRAIYSTKNHDHGSFEELLMLLEPSIYARDCKGRTILHHIAISSRITTNTESCMYYLKCIADYVAHSRLLAEEAMSVLDSQSDLVSVTFSKFIDAQDKSMNTALHLACKHHNYRMVDTMLRLCADLSIEGDKGVTSESLATNDARLAIIFAKFSDSSISVDMNEVDDYDDAYSSEEDCMTVPALLHDCSENNSKSLIASVLYNASNMVSKARLNLSTSRANLEALREEMKQLSKVTTHEPTQEQQHIPKRIKVEHRYPTPDIAPLLTIPLRLTSEMDILMQKLAPGTPPLEFEAFPGSIEIYDQIKILNSTFESGLEMQANIDAKMNESKEVNYYKSEVFVKKVANTLLVSEFSAAEIMEKFDESSD